MTVKLQGVVLMIDINGNPRRLYLVTPTSTPWIFPYAESADSPRIESGDRWCVTDDMHTGSPEQCELGTLAASIRAIKEEAAS